MAKKSSAKAEDKNYRIVKLAVHDLKRIEAVEIEPDGSVIEIVGRNGQGKTSLIDAIWWALGGKKAIQSDPVRHGAEEAIIELEFGDLIVRRIIEPEGKTKLTVSNKEGAAYRGPQEMLDELVGDLTFDPLAFCRMAPAEQFEVLKRFVPSFDFADNAKKRQAAYDLRRDINRDLKSATERHKAAASAVPSEPVERVDIGKAQSALDEAQAVNNRIRDAGNEKAGIEQNIDRLTAQIQSLEKQLSELKAEKDGHQAELDDFPEIPEPQDEAPLRARLDEAIAQNSKAAVYEERVKSRDELSNEAARLDADSKAKTAEIEALDRLKIEALEKADLPVDDLGFGDGHITKAGVPFDQSSGAEQLRTAIAIGMAANPALRVLLVRDGSLLDKDSMAALHKIAEENDFQVWLEKVADDTNSGVIIEAGRVVKDATKAAKAEKG